MPRMRKREEEMGEEDAVGVEGKAREGAAIYRLVVSLSFLLLASQKSTTTTTRSPAGAVCGCARRRVGRGLNYCAINSKRKTTILTSH